MMKMNKKKIIFLLIIIAIIYQIFLISFVILTENPEIFDFGTILIFAIYQGIGSVIIALITVESYKWAKRKQEKDNVQK